MKVKCLINHCNIVFVGKIYQVWETEDGGRFGLRVRVRGSDGGPVWLSADYNGVVEYEIVEV